MRIKNPKLNLDKREKFGLDLITCVGYLPHLPPAPGPEGTFEQIRGWLLKPTLLQEAHELAGAKHTFDAQLQLGGQWHPFLEMRDLTTASQAFVQSR